MCTIATSDAAHLFRLALEKGSAGARYHGVAEEAVPLRDIADVIGRSLNVPVVGKSAEHFGFLEPFVRRPKHQHSTVDAEPRSR